MEMLKHTSGFKGGMNKDISPNEYPNTCYYDAHNLRVITDSSDGLSTASLATPKGTIVSFTLPTNQIYLGSTTLRDNLILLAKDTTIGELKPDKVYVIPLSSIITGGLIVNGTYLVYEQDLDFNVLHPIRIVGNYENADVQKIYFADGYNPLRHLNIVDGTYNNLSTLDPELLNILPNHTYGTYTLSELAGGHLKSGRIQYSYQLYSVSGTETMFAPPSQLFNLTNSDNSDGTNFVGAEVETEINKSIKIEIELDALVTNTFNRIRLVSLEYETYGDVPKVRVVAELALGTSTIIFIDSGNSIGELTLEEFQLIRNEITPKTIESKNSYLFAANITQEKFDIDDLAKELLDNDSAFVDTRAYRWRYVEDGGTASGSQVMDETTDAEGIANLASYDTNSFDVTMIEWYPTAWKFAIFIDPQAHGTIQTPIRTVTGISSVGTPSNPLTNFAIIRLYCLRTDPMGWDQAGGLTLDLNTAVITGWDPVTRRLEVQGSAYMPGGSPDDLVSTYGYSYPTDYTPEALTGFKYTYSYTYVLAGSTKFECVINLGKPALSNELVIDSGSGPEYDDVLENDDCINTYNNIENDTSVEHAFKYKSGASDPPTVANLGGSGKYIEYDFDLTDATENLDGIAVRYTIGTTNYYIAPNILTNSYANPQTVINYTSYQRDEVYRFAIEFYDLKGRPSFVKWIADIRFPDISEFIYTGSNSASYEIAPGADETIMDGLALGIRFTIDWTKLNTDYPGLLEQLSGFQIVRSPRTEDDCTIKAQGIIVPTHEVKVANLPELKSSSYSSFNITSAKDYQDDSVNPIATLTGSNVDLNKDLVELLSPEIAINKDLIVNTDYDYLEVIGYLENISIGSIVETPSDQKSYTVTATRIASLDKSPTLISNRRKAISSAIVSFPEAKIPTSRIIGGESFTPRGYDDTDAFTPPNVPEMTYKGVSLVAKIDSVFTNVTSGGAAGEEKAMYGRYRRYCGYSIYGGATYYERSYSTYISAGDFQAIASPTGQISYVVYGGDVYICPFNFMKLFYDFDAEYAAGDNMNSGQALVAFPTESKINLMYKLDNIPKYFTVPNNPDTYPDYYIAEKQSIGMSQYPNTYPDMGDLYRYNSAYSAVNVGKIFIPKPFDYKATNINDILVTSSERKTNGEYSDSWLKFKYNNYLELEGEYGEIIRIINNNEKLVAFQPRAIAVLSVAERELVETNNTTSLAVGTGGILSRYDYITRIAGTSLYEAITTTETGIYFYDDKNIKIYRILEGLEPISDTKGLKSYYESNSPSNVLMTYDRDNREVLLTDIGTVVVPGDIHITRGALYNWYMASQDLDFIPRYGYLYNWYAVTDARNIANTGWHIPSKDEYDTLVTYLGGSTVAGGILKETGLTYWNTPNTGATNAVGFNGRGAGARYWSYPGIGVYLYLKDRVHYWTSDEYPGDITRAYSLWLTYLSASSSMTPTNFKVVGCSVRLIKDSTTLTHGQTGTYIGNNGRIYNTICIDSYEWLSENLCETKYSNGDNIVEVINDNDWAALSTGARCSYNTDESYVFSIVVDESKSLANVGWHVPTNTDFTTLQTYLDGPTVSGGHLKEDGTTHWDADYADNSSLFTALPSGSRSSTGVFSDFTNSTWYYSSETDGVNAYALYIFSTDVVSSLSASHNYKIGFPIRLIKDSTTLTNGQVGTYVGHDGKVYPTICIGTQEWLGINLAETKYRYGNTIPVVTTNVAWAALTTGAMCYYDNDISNAITTDSDTYLFEDSLCFSGYIDTFTGFYTLHTNLLTVKNYIPFDKYLLSSLDGNTFYLHNAGNYNEFYGEYKESSLSLIINPAKTNVVTFHTINWLTDLTSSGIDQLTETFDTLQVTDTHQDSGIITLSTRDDLKRRYRFWRINTIRDSIDGGRIRDSWIKTVFTWLANSNKKLVVHPIDFMYLPTKIR